MPSRKGMSAAGIVAIIGMAAMLLCGGIVAIALGMTAKDPGPEPFVVGSGRSNYADVHSAAKTKLVLEVTGTGKADISYNIMGTGGSDNGAVLPWRVELGPFDGYIIVSMLAQTKSGASDAVVHGKITYGEKVWECDGKGAYAVATCTGTNG